MPVAAAQWDDINHPRHPDGRFRDVLGAGTVHLGAGTVHWSTWDDGSTSIGWDDNGRRMGVRLEPDAVPELAAALHGIHAGDDDEDWLVDNYGDQIATGVDTEGPYLDVGDSTLRLTDADLPTLAGGLDQAADAYRRHDAQQVYDDDRIDIHGEPMAVALYGDGSLSVGWDDGLPPVRIPNAQVYALVRAWRGLDGSDEPAEHTIDLPDGTLTIGRDASGDIYLRHPALDVDMTADAAAALMERVVEMTEGHFERTLLASAGTRRVAAGAALARRDGVELIRTGSWRISTGAWTASREDLAAAVAARSCPAIRRPILKVGHTDQRFTGDGEPAIGWVDNMRLTDGGHTLVGDYVGVPAWLDGIMASAYPDRSVEGAYNHRCQLGHTHPFVLSGVALLGVTPPGVGTLRSLNSLDDVKALYGLAASAAGAGEVRIAASVHGGTVTAAEVDQDQLKRYWTKDPRGLAKWRSHPHPWTALYRHLKKHMPDEMAKRVTSEWFHEVFGMWPGTRKGANPVGPG